MLTLLLLHFVPAACAGPLMRRFGRRGFLLLAAVPLAAAVWAGSNWETVAGGGEITTAWRWVPGEHLTIALRLDALATVMVLLAGGVGAVVLVYCARYFEDTEPGLGRFAGNLLSFAGAMLGLILADDLILLYVFWELTSVVSFLLIGHGSEERTNRRSALQALLVTTLGGLVMLVGFIMLGERAGTYRISELVAHPPPHPGTVVPTALVLILVGALSKSALWPFSLWLPGAMSAPTPVSAYLHAAAMVKAGVYLIARLAPGYADVGPWRSLVVVMGSATLLLGGWRALRLNDLKLLLAHGTVSQLGFLTVLVGTGTRNTALGGVAMVLAHALFKAPLFLVVGIIDHGAGTRDLRRLSGVGRQLPLLCAVAVVAGASMAAIPPLLGFSTKEAAFQALLEGQATDRCVLAACVAGSALTTAYTLRFLWGAFARKPGREDTPVERPGALFLTPPTLLAAGCLALGPGIGSLDRLLASYTDAFPAPHHPYRLSLWHGLGTALLLSVSAWLAGATLFALNAPLRRLQRRVAWPDAGDVFGSVLLGLERVSLQVTGAVQRGSLPVYLSTALLVLVGGEAVELAVDRPWDAADPPRLWDSPVQAAVGVATAVVAVLCLLAERRMRAVILVGLTGYGTAVLFVLHGAPDLALTQFCVETVSLVVFVLVLRRLPIGFREAVRPWRRVAHLPLGVVAGVVSAALLWMAAAVRPRRAAGVDLAEATDGERLKNVVSTTLVELRAWDTLGESSVLVTAAAGVTSLIFLRLRAGPPPPLSVRRRRAADSQVWAMDQGDYPMLRGGGPERTWLAAGGSLAPERRSIVFEVIARLTFHPILVLSAFLLFSAANLPGGGFAGGLVAGLALVVRYLAGGRYELAEAAPVGAGFLTGLGLTVCTGTALLGLLGGPVLTAGTFHGHLVPFGAFHAASPVLFDTGVYLLVLGVVLDILRAFGGEIDGQIERETADRDGAP